MQFAHTVCEWCEDSLLPSMLMLLLAFMFMTWTAGQFSSRIVPDTGHISLSGTQAWINMGAWQIRYCYQFGRFGRWQVVGGELPMLCSWWLWNPCLRSTYSCLLPAKAGAGSIGRIGKQPFRRLALHLSLYHVTVWSIFVSANENVPRHFE